MPLRQFVEQEARFAMLMRGDPERAERLLALAQADAYERWRYYSQLAGLERSVPDPAVPPGPLAPPAPKEEG
jgi:pyruvate-ferredoxin/flavodoxin oxidoreductase